MLTFTKQTTPRDEIAIENDAARLRKDGFNGDGIVYRNAVDTSLARIALYSLALSSPPSSIVHPLGTYIVIGTKNYEDGKKIREQVEKLREMVAPAFGITPEEPNPAPAASPSSSQKNRSLNL